MKANIKCVLESRQSFYSLQFVMVMCNEISLGLGEYLNLGILIMMEFATVNYVFFQFIKFGHSIQNVSLGLGLFLRCVKKR